jgi:hypothetical protein
VVLSGGAHHPIGRCPLVDTGRRLYGRPAQLDADERHTQGRRVVECTVDLHVVRTEQAAVDESERCPVVTAARTGL